MCKASRRTLVGLTLPYLAALTPRDPVAITAWTINSFRAYEIPDRFRTRGIPVVVGGPHTYCYAEEAAEHCDAVGIGEGERVWPAILEDAVRGRLQQFYRADPLPI